MVPPRPVSWKIYGLLCGDTVKSSPSDFWKVPTKINEFYQWYLYKVCWHVGTQEFRDLYPIILRISYYNRVIWRTMGQLCFPWHFLTGNRNSTLSMVDAPEWDAQELSGYREGNPYEISSNGEWGPHWDPASHLVHEAKPSAMLSPGFLVQVTTASHLPTNWLPCFYLCLFKISF